MRVVLDCNVIVSAGTKDGFVRYVLLRIFEEHTIVISSDIVSEYVRVSRYPKFTAATMSYVSDTIARIEGCSDFVEPVDCGENLPDQDDIPYVDAAISGNADYIITGNLKHFPDRKYGAAQVVSVREFAELAGMLP